MSNDDWQNNEFNQQQWNSLQRLFNDVSQNFSKSFDEQNSIDESNVDVIDNDDNRWNSIEFDFFWF